MIGRRGGVTVSPRVAPCIASDTRRRLVPACPRRPPMHGLPVSFLSLFGAHRAAPPRPAAPACRVAPRGGAGRASRSRWQGSADYKVDAPAERIFAVLRAADATDQNVVRYVVGGADCRGQGRGGWWAEVGGGGGGAGGRLTGASANGHAAPHGAASVPAHGGVGAGSSAGRQRGPPPWRGGQLPRGPRRRRGALAASRQWPRRPLLQSTHTRQRCPAPHPSPHPAPPTRRSYVNVDFEVARSANAGGVNAGFRAASDSARLEATAYLDAVGRKLGPLLGTQSYDNSTFRSCFFLFFFFRVRVGAVGSGGGVGGGGGRGGGEGEAGGGGVGDTRACRAPTPPTLGRAGGSTLSPTPRDLTASVTASAAARPMPPAPPLPRCACLALTPLHPPPSSSTHTQAAPCRRTTRCSRRPSRRSTLSSCREVRPAAGTRGARRRLGRLGRRLGGWLIHWKVATWDNWWQQGGNPPRAAHLALSIVHLGRRSG